MRIGLISDTHIPEVVHNLPAEIHDLFSDVDLILHAGDIYTISVLDELECLAPVLAAEGDDDYDEVWKDNRVKYKHILTIEGVTIGFQIKILDCVIGRNPRRRTYMHALLGFLPLALPKSLSETLYLARTC